MRQVHQSSFDDATAVAGLSRPGTLLAALPEVSPSDAVAAPLPSDVPAPIAELLGLIGEQLGQEAVVAILVPELVAPVPVLGLVTGSVPPAPSEPLTEFVVQPLEPAVIAPLSLEDRDLFGTSGQIMPLGSEEVGGQELFKGFQVDLFGPTGPEVHSLEAGMKYLSGPMAPPEFETGRVTMFAGATEIEVTPDLAAAIGDEHGRLLVEGDGDDVVVLSDGWTPAKGGPDPDGFTFYQDSASGLTVGVRGAEILLV